MTWQQLLDKAEAAADEGDFETAIEHCAKAREQGDDANYFATMLQADLFLEVGEPERALEAYESLAALDDNKNDPEVACGRGMALFELTRLSEASEALSQAIEMDPEMPDAHFALGMIAELTASAEAAAHFARAAEIDPNFTLAPALSDEEFDAVVKAALEELPDTVKTAVADIPVLVEELPTLEELRMASPPLSPTSLGMFVGEPPASVSVLDAGGKEQAMILLFKKNLERAFPEREELQHEITMTVLHEVGHALGLTETDLDARGLD